ncbi:hypothetical protein [Actinomadura fibrosa]|uniref:Uncharacterized protein n=1 Tax=Actinomadura fibrosa TaxID=111802 RepID=A0ABW2XG87_9ACTN|nr:hypothetical protein [Actinomadura fibrosa]
MDERNPRGGGVERGASEEASGVPLTPTEEETSRRPASETPREGEGRDDPMEHGGSRPEDLNPDDFE